MLQQQMMMGMAPPPDVGAGGNVPGGLMPEQKPDIQGGRGYGGLQRAINEAGDTKGLV